MKNNSKQFLIRNRKGLSDVVTTLIIILLSLVAIGIVWVVVSNLLSSGAEDVGTDQFSVDVNFKKAVVEGNRVNLTVQRTSGDGTVVGLKFIITDGQNSETFEEEVSMNKLDTKSFSYLLATLQGGSVTEASVTPVYLSAAGEEKVGSPTDTVSFGSFSDGGGEQGPDNTGFCGDSIIQNPNGEDPVINEQCDFNESNLGGNSCTTIVGGFLGGTLGCSSQCQFDTSQCTSTGGEGSGCTTADDCSPGYVCVDNECTCPDSRTYAQVCADLGAECGMVQNNCGINIDCDAVEGLGCNENLQVCSNNLCVDLTATATGTVYSVWPEGVAIYFDSADLPNNETLTDNFVRVNPPRDTNCYPMEDYVLPQPPQTRVQIKLQGLTTEIVEGDAVQLWPSYQSCLNSL